MDAVSSPHPTDQLLASYGLGKLDDSSADSVSTHLESCPDCRRRVGELSSDSFLGRLREAKAAPIADASMVDATLSFVQANVPAGPPPSADTIPPGLADHPDYEIKRELGRGGMGVVYLAHNTMMGRDEVLKVIGREIMQRPSVLERFQREIRAVAKLRHPNIVAAYTAFRIEGGLVFAMEYVEGLDLSKMVKLKGPLPVLHASYFAHQAALGLQHAHERGMIHRDIKPHNLMLTGEGKARIVKVLDFGLAKASLEQKVDTSLTREGQALGTPDYIAPEQILNANSVDIRADIYSLGATLFYLLTGRPPFSASSLYDIYQAHISRDADPLNLVRPEVPAELAALVAKMMAKEPRRRFQTPGEVAEALRPFFKKERAVSVGIVDALPVPPAAQEAKPATVVPPAPTHALEPSSPAPPPQVSWESLVTIPENDDLSIRAESSKKSTPTNPLRSRKKPVAFVAVGILVLGLIGALLGILRVKTAEGTIVLEGLPDDAIVEVDGRAVPNITIRKTADGEPYLTLTAEKHGIRVTTKEGVEIFGEGEMSVKAGESVTIHVEREQPGAVVQSDLPDVETNRSNFSIVRGNWSIDGDELVQTDMGWGAEHPLLLLGAQEWTNYEVALEVKRTKGNECLFLFDRWKGPDHRIEYKFGYAGNQGHELASVSEGTSIPSIRAINKPDGQGLENNRWYRIKLKIQANEHKCYLDDKLLFEFSDQSFSEGRIGLGTWDSQARFRKIKVTSLDGRILWEGLPNLQSELADAESPDLLNAKAWEFATTADKRKRNGTKAIQLSLRACEKDGYKSPTYLGTLAAAHAENGSFDEAVKWQNQAIEKEGTGGNAKEYRGQLELYKQKKPYHQGDVLPTDAASIALDSNAFQPLFNGRDLTGWSATKDRVRIEPDPKSFIERGELHCPRDTVGQISTVEMYKDFDLKLECKTLPGGTDLESGVFLSTSNDLPPLQVDGVANARAIQFRVFPNETGSLLATGLRIKQQIAPRTVNTEKPIGEWNEVELRYRGTELTCLLNGRLVNRFDLKESRPLHIGINGRGGSDVRYRNIQIKKWQPVVGTNTPTGSSGTFVPLFNGKDLKGWKTHQKQKGNWRVENGVLIGSGAETSHLYSVQEYRDFELHVEARINKGGNGGVYVRAPFGPAWPATNPTWATGYEAQIDNTGADPNRTGSLYVGPEAAVSVRESPIQDGQWFNLDMLVEGSHVVVKIDGKLTADYIDPNRRFATGRIALQQHDPQTSIEFRKIEVQELDKSGKPLASGNAAAKSTLKPAARPRDAKSFQGRFYKVFPQELTWHQAKETCQRLGGHLATITSDEQNRFLISLMRDRRIGDAWLGATDEQVEGRWVWVDGSPMNYSNWSPVGKQPNNKQGQEHYAILLLQHDGTWSDQPDKSVETHPGFTCQWD